MLARNSTSGAREAADSFGFQPANTFSYVSSVAREFRSQPYSPAQKNVRPPMMRSTSARSCPSRSEDLELAFAEVVADRTDQAHAIEETRGAREVSRRTLRASARVRRTAS